MLVVPEICLCLQTIYLSYLLVSLQIMRVRLLAIAYHCATWQFEAFPNDPPNSACVQLIQSAKENRGGVISIVGMVVVKIS